ncbi:MAG TPA: ribonucleoside triphosphate reductase [Candidatus Desulfofervidus auxilii]|uniref:Ribonucleoside triphosphate reductase n=1 Tax=Desulfofervidus auxilii TaxID=1621989 RepID=A0A7V0I9Z3_DESA2|nr:ribonucleoside triphosphate reductase [Candidatus Desulfofervidus auxilii]
MLKKIIKRDGTLETFNPKKITQAIYKAIRAVGKDDYALAENLTKQVVQILEKQYDEKRPPQVEEIQDIVEFALVDNRLYEIAKAYIIYRHQHRQLREIKSLLDPIKLIQEYLTQSDWLVKENSNMTFSLQGLNSYILRKTISEYWLIQIYPKEIASAHRDGDFHIHDLDFLGAYCCGWDLRDLLMVGFGGVTGKVESRPAKHFRSALGQVVNFFFTLQGETAGAQAFSNFDTYLAPFIRYDGLSYKQVKQALQEFLFNMNIPTRTGFQTPFTNVTLDLKVPEFMKNEAIIIGGELKEATYGEFQKEINIFNQAFAEVMTEGDAKGRPFTFPIPTYNITKDFDWENEHYKSIWEMTRRYGIPYFANFVSTDMRPEDARSMCCRLRLDLTELKKRGGALFGSHPLTGSIGVITINMPRIGYLSKTEEEFFDRLENLMFMAKEALEIKRKVIERFTDMGLYPYSRYYLRNIKKRFNNYWKNHFSTIGLIGMNEALLNFSPLRCTIAEKKGIDFTLKVLDFMREKLLKFQAETQNIYNLEATPAESTCHRLALLDKERFSDIVTQGEGKGVYYTNSTQLPVNYTDDVFEALELQDKIQTKYTGGTVLHIFLGESLPDINAVKQLVKKVVENYRLPYFTITPTFSICPKCGYLKGKVEKCPHCGSVCEVFSRSVGYLRPVKQWNEGKQTEFKMRKNYNFT